MMMMNSGLVVVLLAFACTFATVAVAADDFPTEEGVIVATEDTFDSILSAHPNALVEFYAPWCGHCKSLAPEYAKAAQQLADDGVDAVLVKVDATANEKLAERFEVQGYPTLKFFKNGADSEYNGGRVSDEIVSWVKKKSGPPATEVADVDGLKDFVGDNDVVVVGVFNSLTSDEASEFVVVAGNSDLLFAITTSKDIASEYGVSSPGIFVLRTFDEPKIVFDGEFDVASINDFVNGAAVPLVIEFTSENAPKIFNGPVHTHLLFFINGGRYVEYEGLVKTVANEFLGKVLTVYVNIDNEENGRILEFFDVDAAAVPTARLINIDNHLQKFALTGEVTVDSLSSFAQGFLDNTLKPYLKSEPVPEDWDAEPVKVLTGGNFEEVISSGKNVFVEFYAPWCGHCKQLTPIWDQLAENFASVGDVVVAKIDATANELEDHPIEGFPTLKLFTSEGHVVPFEGARDLGALTDFLNEHAGTDIEATESEGAAEGEGDYADYNDYGDYADYDENAYGEDTTDSSGEGHDEL